ncbi:MAG: TadE/TadG family type IV pilus assembly protein [Planctomycetota bacterium]
MKSRRKGATLVEFAVVLPIIFVLFFSIVSVSRVLLLQHTADTAAYEAARAAMVPGATSTEAILEAQNLLDAADINSASIVVDPSSITQETAFVTVTVEIPVEQNSWVLPDQFSSHVLTSNVTLLTERSPIVRITEMPKIKLKKDNTNEKDD